MKPKELINSLKSSKKLRMSCPECNCTIHTSKAILFTEEGLTQGALEFLDAQKEEIEDLKKELLNLKKKKLERVQRGTRSSNFGKILERYVPVLPGFRYRPEECIPLLDPIDYISFNGLAKNKIQSLTFMDVKSGNGRLGDQQKSTMKAIESGKVSLDLIKRGK